METLSSYFGELIDFLSEISWSMIIGVCIGGGILATIGDRVGMKFAKRRVTLFGLRPKSTSTIITGVTGMVISLCVMGALSMTSETVRTALFSMKFLAKQTVELTSQLQASRQEQKLSALLAVENQEKLTAKEEELKKLQEQTLELNGQIEPLRKERDELTSQTQDLRSELAGLRQTLSRFQEGRIIMSAGELMGQQVVPESAESADEVRQLVEKLLERIRYETGLRSGVSPSSVKVNVTDDQINQIVNRCRAIASRKVIRATADVNIVAGEEISPVFRVFETELIFRKGEVILERTLHQPNDSDEAERSLSTLLNEVNHMAADSGVLTDPVTGTVGNISANDFFDAVKQIESAKGNAVVTIRADRDIYSEGPVRVDIEVESRDPS